MKLIFLGTGSGVPSKERNVSAIALELLQEKGSVWLFDCGEATQHQILRTNIRPRKIDKIFITHLHGDHIYGLPGLLSSRSFQSGESPLTIFGPPGIKEYVEASLRVSGTSLTYELFYKEVNDGVIFEDESFRVLATKLEHGVTCFGYRVIEKDKPGQLQPEKLAAAGIQPGPIYQQIKDTDSVTLPDGRTINSVDFIGPNKPGRVITILGDTRYLPTLSSFIKESDVLVHEATFGSEEEQLADQYYHSTTKQAATLAKHSDVKQLILTHISSRYQQDEHLLAEARQLFINTDIAFDFYEKEIPSKS
ncbi:ribonuclease Z [Aquibacillus albus]|uniref:Ribonuclease Z n=1 Tax=Aquibacillus albus TaxID=1168171 RepID=A0ABS2MVB2_9BACI|nr:ribonuclease Z [Aquibacillus albus]MBM7569748.1 ribonuclease Z [Aquibacillus albus]